MASDGGIDEGVDPRAAAGGDRDPAVDSAVAELCAAGRWMGARGFLPATSGNLSCRVSPTRVAVTASGGDKAELRPEDIVVIDIAGAVHPASSAETPLHLLLYRARPDCGAVLHGHSLRSTLVSQARASEGAVVLSGYELLKAFAGIGTHEAALEIPIFPNSQDMNELATQVGERLARLPPAWAWLLAGHGFYVWGRSVAEARRHAEALDFLLGCEWEKMKLRP